MYILCFAQKDRLRGDFGPLQSGRKGVISKIGLCYGGYAYILSMGRDCVRVENTHSFAFFFATPSMDRNWRGSAPQSDRHHPATAPLSSARGPLAH
jgi:hypothetical protein